jgi:hypothetical protein
MISHEKLIEKINSLPRRRIEEVEDFVDFLSNKDSAEDRAQRAERIAEFARDFGGTSWDLDPELEAAGIEELLAIDEDPRR